MSSLKPFSHNYYIRRTWSFQCLPKPDFHTPSPEGRRITEETSGPFAQEICPSSASRKAYDPPGRAQCHHGAWRPERTHWHWSAVSTSPEEIDKASPGGCLTYRACRRVGWLPWVPTIGNKGHLMPPGAVDLRQHGKKHRWVRTLACGHSWKPRPGRGQSLALNAAVSLSPHKWESHHWESMYQHHSCGSISVIRGKAYCGPKSKSS